MTKEVKTIADIANATAIDLGPLAEVKDYVLELLENPPAPEIADFLARTPRRENQEK